MKVFLSLMLALMVGMVISTHANSPHANSPLAKTVVEENDPQEVISRYIDAIGGKDKVAKIKNSVMFMEAEVQGMKIEIKGIADQENERFVQETSVMGNVASRTVLANGKGKMVAMGQEQQIPDEMISLMKTQTYVFPEDHYRDLGFTLELQGTEDIEGEQAHKLIITAPNGIKTVEYYSVRTNLKLRTSSEATGDITYSDYQEVDGVKIPKRMTIKNPMMPMALEAKVISIHFNQPLSDDEFK
ncbi:peptidase, M16 family protein [Cecembia calidifontis]|jgi:hypothetical protein|uniref:Outer membrane lipoprotein-sorting protein n=1 Tax=Cecembia calidifontis TaxID=1187080 RepID=A0A4Q7PFI2_9BACT|nr:peptidase, M16 family protein [Cecembia calidifontis]RZS98430.1 hypothetical protein BC751_4085 [Cecembia calidifontis]